VAALDGKALCGRREAGKTTLVQIVSAWASANNLVLAQRKVDYKSNEITAIPKLLAELELSGTVVTVDAMGCQRSIAEKIVAKRADYILAAKENQGNLLAEIKDSFQTLAADGGKEEIDCGHRRVDLPCHAGVRHAAYCRGGHPKSQGQQGLFPGPLVEDAARSSADAVLRRWQRMYITSGGKTGS
jgi:hypothetical protein